MEKPISLKLKEFKNNAVNLINTSGLPLFIVEPILKEILAAVQTKANEEYLQDKAHYENKLVEELKQSAENTQKEGESQND